MFLLRGISVSLAFYFVLYWSISLLVSRGWQIPGRVRGLSPRGMAGLLFAVRLAPPVVSALITLVFVVPSFVRLEPRTIDEDLGIVPLILGVCCLVLFAIGIVRVVRAQARTARVIASWMEDAHALDLGTSTPTFRARQDIPPLTLAGVCRPRVVISESTVSILNEDELRMALRHEIAHLHSRDNLKKLAFHLFPAPGMVKLESAWLDAPEIAADDRAVASAQNALDLAAALIKLSRLVPLQPAPTICMGLLHPGLISSRVARLLAWNGNNGASSHKLAWYAAAPALVVLMGTIAVYGPMLAQVHRLTEWIVQ